jgi:hypothetical protein
MLRGPVFNIEPSTAIKLNYYEITQNYVDIG